MCGYCRKHTQHARGQTVMKYIKHILHSGKAHAHHNGINNTIERLIEVAIEIQDEAYKDEFAEFFTEGHLEEGVVKLIYNIIGLGGNQNVYRYADNGGCECTKDRHR